MVLSLKQTQSNIPQSSSSSCTEYISEIRCGSNRCPKCCISSAINDHTYEVLKKICKKIIKELHRKQCRESYSVFDGGNSIRVKIQRGQNVENNRSSSKIDTNGIGKRDSNFAVAKSRKVIAPGEKVGRYRGKSFGREGREEENGDNDVLETKRDRAYLKNKKEYGENGDDNTYDDKATMKRNKIGSSKSKKNMDNEVDDYNPHSKKFRNKKPRKQNEDLENEDKMRKEKKGKGKSSPDGENDETVQSKKKKDLFKGDDDIEVGEFKKNKSKRDNSKEKRLGRDYADYNGPYNQRRDQNDKKKTKVGVYREENYNDNDIQMIKGNPKHKSKSDIPIVTDLRSKVRRGQAIQSNPEEGESRQNSRKKLKKGKDRLSSLDKELFRLKRKQKTARQLLSDQQENGKSRGKSGKESSRTKGQRSSSRHYGSRSEARIPSKLTRGDQIRTCDILRANMEQRDLCRLCEQVSCRETGRDPCRDSLRDSFTHRACARNVCSEVIQSCYCPSRACFKKLH